MRKKDSRGFTLMELIAVVVIIGVIVSLTVRKLTEVRDRAKISVAQSDVTSMQLALALYEAEHGCYKVGTGSYNGIDGYESFKSNLKDCMSLPDTTNFYPDEFSYLGDDLSFTIKVKTRDSKGTTLVATPTELSKVSQSAFSFL